MSLLPFLGFTFNDTERARASRRMASEEIPPRQKVASALSPNGMEVPLIYVVDNEPHLTELYTLLLEAKGCLVRPFNDRAEALATLQREGRKPDLLVFDLLGTSPPADRFMKLCLEICPRLRILMASGLSLHEVRFSSVRPDRFLQKPFTPEEFFREVCATLAAHPKRLSSGFEASGKG